MSTSCRDALSREISDPVTDPLTGICYRNPCAAEEAGVLDWIPGCVLVQPTYASTEYGPSTWASEVWWSGDSGGGGHRRRRHRHPGHPPGGGQKRPGGGRRIGGGPGPGRVRRLADGGAGQKAPGGASASPGALYRAGGGYTTLTAKIAPGPSLMVAPGQNTVRLGPSTVKQAVYASQPGYATASRSISAPPPMSVSRPTAGPARSMKGLGQTPGANLAGAIGRAVAVVVGGGAVAIASPFVVGGLVGYRTRSWGKALVAGVATVAVGGAILGGYTEYRSRTRTTTAPLTIPSIAYIR